MDRGSERLLIYGEGDEEPSRKDSTQEIQSSHVEEELLLSSSSPPVSVPARLRGLTPRIAADTAIATNNLNAIKNFRDIVAFSRMPSTPGNRSTIEGWSY